MKIILPPKHVVYPFALVSSLFFLWGFAYGLLDVLNKHFQNILGLTKLQSTGLQVAYFGLGYFCFSPVAGEVLRRKSYRFTILMGLSLYSIGAIFFWPCAKFASEDNKKAVFGGFVVCTGIIACGLASLETAANSYLACLPGTKLSGAAFRLQIAQTFNGVAVLTGPFIASKYFFTGENANNLTTVQWAYLAVAGLGVAAAVVFVFFRLPETSEAELEAEVQAAAKLAGVISKTNEPFFKQYRALFGWLAQFLFVGAQSTIISFFINYGAEAVGWPDNKSSKFLSYSLILFTCGRVFGIIVLTFWPVELMVGLWGTFCAILITCAVFVRGTPGMACLMVTFFFEGPLVPCIFVSSTKNLGRHTRRASSLLVSAVAGGAVFPPTQGAIADAHGTRISFAVCIPAFAYTAAFGFFLWYRNGASFRLQDETESTPDEERASKEVEKESLGLNRHPSSEDGPFDIVTSPVLLKGS
ncbi:major facilitator superfamily transporter [Ceratobasidium sp. AG-I]|nr:major facilitator superfamily transporter [Ceratobasidium sp. AG-I]